MLDASLNITVEFKTLIKVMEEVNGIIHADPDGNRSNEDIREVQRNFKRQHHQNRHHDGKDIGDHRNEAKLDVSKYEDHQQGDHKNRRTKAPIEVANQDPQGRRQRERKAARVHRSRLTKGRGDFLIHETDEMFELGNRNPMQRKVHQCLGRVGR